MEEGEPRVPKTRINEMLARSDAAQAAAQAAFPPIAQAAFPHTAQAAFPHTAQVGVSMVVRTLDGSEVDLDAAQEFAQEFEFMTGRPWPRNSRLLVQSERRVGQSAAAPAAASSMRKRPSSEADLEDAPGREERLRLLRANEDARKHYERQRDQAQKERDVLQKECLEAQTKCREAHALCARAQKASNEWRRLCSEAQKERNESLKLLWQMRGRELDDLPEAQLEQLAEDIKVAKERVEKMQLRRKAEALVLAKHPDYGCPISLALMRDPVVTDDGQSYERKEIEAWFKTQREAHEPLTSPLRAPLKSAQLVANHSLRRAIEAAVYAEAELCI